MSPGDRTADDPSGLFCMFAVLMAALLERLIPAPKAAPDTSGAPIGARTLAKDGAGQPTVFERNVSLPNRRR